MAVACGSLFSAALTERGGVWVFEQGAPGVSGNVPLLLGGVGLVVGDEVSALAPSLAALARAAGEPVPTGSGAPHVFAGEALAMVSAAGRSVACVADSGTVWVWGGNGTGQLGLGHEDGQTAPHRWPHAECGGELMLMVACGAEHLLALTQTGLVWACGAGNHGQNGQPGEGNVLEPMRVAGLHDIAMVAAGTSHSAAVGRDGRAWTWGGDAHGQLGHRGDTRGRLASTPAGPWAQPPAWRFPTPRCLALQAVVLVAAGHAHTAAVTEPGALWVWGDGGNGRLGLGDTVARRGPELVHGAWAGARVLAAACGCDHTVVLTGDGAVWSMGSGLLGNLGHGDNADRWTPARVPPHHFDGLEMVAVAAGNSISMAVSAEGFLFSWGSGALGHIDPLETRTNVPVPVAASLARGARIARSCALPRLHATALAMGLHARLGASTVLADVPSDIIQRIAKLCTQDPPGCCTHMRAGLRRLVALDARES